ncbi:MAG: stage III sporulation AC/AD family protein [Lachnospiraceae bacterium]|nr:stage III sporulation AC/AD family protein [Lachnospiraceae bacterium]
MIHIILAGVAAAMLALWVKPLKPEYALFLSLAAILLLMGASLGRLQEIIELVSRLMNRSGVESVYYQILLKIMGLAWISQLASDICDEAGCRAISQQISIYGKLMILAVSLPVINSVIETIETIFPG